LKNIEIEQKYKIKNPAAIRKALKRLGAKRAGSGLEQNEFYDQRGRLRQKRLTLRLRKYRGQGKLTFKGPRKAGLGKLSKRVEVESSVAFAQIRRLLELLGFKKWLSYSKTRETWELAGAEVVIDHFPRFGWFVEIEAAHARRIRQLSRALGLTPDQAVAESYLAMQLRA